MKQVKRKINFQFKVSSSQYRLIAEMMANVAVAWFVVGVISPIYLGWGNLVTFAILLISGLAGSGIFAVFALILIEEGKNG